MVSQVSSTTFAKNAIRYIQDTPLKDATLGDEIKGSIGGSLAFGTIFQAAPAVISGLKNKKKYGGFINALNARDEAKKLAEQAAQASAKEGKKGLFSKIGSKLKSVLKLDKLGGKLATKFPKVAKFFKGSGIGGIAIFTGVMSLFTEVIPAYKNGGAKEGTKQLAKSAVNTAVDAVSWAAGAKVGASIGTAVGGPVGTIVGGVLGMALGGVASLVATKLTSKVIGKNYSEKQMENTEQQQAKEIGQDAASMEELKLMVEQKIKEDQADGEISDDTAQMIVELNKMKNQGTSFGSLTTTSNPTGISTDYSTSINQGVRDNILKQQANGIYELNNLPKNADGSFNHSIYNADYLVNKEVA